MDLVLSVGARLHRPSGADQVPRARQRARAQTGADVDRGQPPQRDPLRVADDEMRIAVAVGIDPLDVDDPPDRLPAGGMPGRAVRGLNRLCPTPIVETAETLAVYGFLRFRRLLAG
ncbi:MAG TPA: hypothetical protein VEP91_09990 [Solirubrobacterales bacterium]|nr:hypothetical protein [Solirubrobacterales bacterium]